MSVRNLKDGHKKPWLCECYPQGWTGKRIRKRFATRGKAIAFERYTDNKPWHTAGCRLMAENYRQRLPICINIQ